MFDVISDWYRRHFSDPQVVILAIVLLLSLFGILLVGDILAPVFVAVLLAYLLEGVVASMARAGVPRVIGAAIVRLPTGNIH